MVNPGVSKLLIYHSHCHLLYGKVSFVKLHLTPWSSLMCVNILLVSFTCGTSCSTSVWLISDCCVSIFKMFHPPSDTAGTEAGISIHTKKLPTDACSELFSFTRNSFTACWQNYMSLTAILSQWIVGTLVVFMH